jgi:hypothetical protein
MGEQAGGESAIQAVQTYHATQSTLAGLVFWVQPVNKSRIVFFRGQLLSQVICKYIVAIILALCTLCNLCTHDRL